MSKALGDGNKRLVMAMATGTLEVVDDIAAEVTRPRPALWSAPVVMLHYKLIPAR